MVLAEIYNTKNVHLKKLLTEKAYSFKILPVNLKSANLSDEYLRNKIVPAGYAEDALHIAIASINKIDYLLSWNFEHLVKMKTRDIVNKVNISRHYPQLQIITPAELL